LHKYEDCCALRAKPDRAPVGRRTVRARAVTPSHAIRGVAGVAAFIIVLGLLIAPPVPDLSDNFSREFASLAPSRVAPLSFISAAQAQTDTLANSPSDPVRAYHNALDRFKSILRERRAQIDSNRQLPNLPGQALYVARNEMISTYKDLTDALPSKIGRPNGLGIPPPYFDADNEPLLDEYRSLFDLMQAPHANAQKSDTPFRDVFDLGRTIGRARGLDAASAEVAGRISLGIFFAETNGKQNMGNARSNTYKGSLQTGVSEDRNGQIKWAAIKRSIIALDPALGDRDAREEMRIGNLDHRLNHWTAVRDGLMNAHAELFPQIPMIVKVLPNPIDQMKFFELIQIIPSPTKAALKSGGLANYKISDPRIMRYLRNNSIFTFGNADRARTSATLRDTLNAMWLFNGVFERALAKFIDIKAH
jgi:hypothetical protein